MAVLCKRLDSHAQLVPVNGTNHNGKALQAIPSSPTVWHVVYCFDRPDRSFEWHAFARGRCGHSNFASVLHEVLWSLKNPFTMLHSPVHLHFFVPQPASNCTMAVLLAMLATSTACLGASFLVESLTSSSTSRCIASSASRC